MHALKKAPHGGVFYINRSNYFLNYYPVSNAFQAFFPKLNGEITNQFVFHELICIIDELMNELSISEDDLFLFIRTSITDDWWSPSFCFDSIHAPCSHNFFRTYDRILDECNPIDESMVYNKEKLQIVFIYSLSCTIGFGSINDILDCEKLPDASDKYGLIDVSHAQFDRDGYILDNQYYLYNIFLDKSINTPSARKPLIIELLLDVKKASIYMRKDATLSLPSEKAIKVSTWDFQLFRGISLNSIDYERIRKKEIIVHYDPQTNNKLYMSIVPMEATDPHVLSLVIEELWNPYSIPDENITTTFIHATYNTDTKFIEHMDLSINEYNKELYIKKHTDSVSSTTVAIDKYAEAHYKVWCIKSETMSLTEWGRIAFASLSNPFRVLFKEITNSLFTNLF